MIAQVAVTCFDRLIPCKTEGIEQCDPLGISERGQAALLDERHADGRADANTEGVFRSHAADWRHARLRLSPPQPP